MTKGHSTRSIINPRRVFCKGWSTFKKRVYRLDECSVAHLKPAKKLQGKFAALLNDVASCNINLEAKMLKDYLSHSIQDGKVYSIPETFELPLALEDERSGPEIRPDPIVFQAVSTKACNLKMNTTIGTSRFKCMKHPIMVQPLSLWRYSGRPLDPQFVIPVGVPEFRDLIAMAPGRQIICNLVQWSIDEESDVSGTLSIGNPVQMALRQWTA